VSPDELNEQCIERLTQAALAERVAIVGSGPSTPHIAPIGKLEELLTERCGIIKNEGEEFWKFAERAHNANADEYFDVVRQTYEETPYWSADVYAHLVAMPFKAFATFNYDDQLPRAFRGRYPDTYGQFFSVYPPHADLTYFSPQELLGSPPRLIALHGYCDPDNGQWEKQAVLRTADYNHHYGEPPASLFDWWRNMLLAAPCIFVGTSLTEPGLFRVLEYLRDNQRDRLDTLNHLHVLDAPRDAREEYPRPGKSLWVVEQVYYDRIDSRHSGLLRILSEFSKLPIDRPRPRVPALKPITQTDDFNFKPL
jgi:hypothetical protein